MWILPVILFSFYLSDIVKFMKQRLSYKFNITVCNVNAGLWFNSKWYQEALSYENVEKIIIIISSKVSVIE